MKKSYFAMVIVVLAAALGFLVLNTVLYHEDFAGSVYEKGIPLAISGFVLALIPYVSQHAMEEKGRFRFNTLPRQIVRFEAYTLPWHLMLIYGAFLVFAARGIGIFIIWLIGLGSGFFLTQAIPILTTVIVSLAVYFASSWVGARVDRRPFLTAIGIVLAYNLMTAFAELSLGSDFEFVPLVARLLLSLVIALFGAWRGVRARPTRYIQYLLDFIPFDEQHVVLRRSYSEVDRLARGESGVEPGAIEEKALEAYSINPSVMKTPPADNRS